MPAFTAPPPPLTRALVICRHHNSGLHFHPSPHHRPMTTTTAAAAPFVADPFHLLSPLANLASDFIPSFTHPARYPCHRSPPSYPGPATSTSPIACAPHDPSSHDQHPPNPDTTLHNQAQGQPHDALSTTDPPEATSTTPSSQITPATNTNNNNNNAPSSASADAGDDLPPTHPYFSTWAPPSSDDNKEDGDGVNQTPRRAEDFRAVASAVSSATSLNEALADCAARALADLVPGHPPDIALVFVSAKYAVSKVGPNRRETLADLAPCLRAFFPGLKAVFGCTTDGVIGNGVEMEERPALSLTLLRLPHVSFKTFHVMPDDLPSLDASQADWRHVFGNIKQAKNNEPPAFLLLSDPAFAERGDLQRCLAGLQYAYPGSTVFGSVAAAGAGYAKGHLLCTLPRDVLGAEVSSALRDNGLIGLALSGDVEVDCIVAHGCLAIGPTFEVRKVLNKNIILELEQPGVPGSILSAMGHLRRLIDYATPTEKRLMQTELHVGFPPSEFDDVVAKNRFIARNVIAFDQDSGGISVGCQVRPGQRIRFAVKDDRTAEDILDDELQRFKRAELTKSLVGYSNPPLGALMFTDEGRGAKLFRESGYESRHLANFVPGVPVSGFFGAAQIGPSRNEQEESGNEAAVIHNATSVIAFIRKRSAISPLNPPDSPLVE